MPSFPPIVHQNPHGQWRVGAHLTGFKMGPVQLGLSAGYLNDRKLGSGLYTVVDGRIAF